MTTRGVNAQSERVNLGSLGDEIRQGILNLCVEGHYDKAVIESEIQAIIEKSAMGSSSDPSVGLLLFRKYADITNDIVNENYIETKISFNHVQFQFDPSALILQDINEDKLVGVKALGEKVFWLRVTTSVFAFISMVLMASIPNIGDSNFCPSFDSNCSMSAMYYKHDCFPQRPYWFLVATAAAIVAHNLCLCWYYLLSTNYDGKKFIPGVCVLAECPCFVNPLVDFILLSSSIAAAIAGSVTLQKAVYFEYGQYRSGGFFTISSLYELFSHPMYPYDLPACLHAADDPSPKMFASIVMMFLTVCLMCLCFAASFNHYHKQCIALTNDVGVGPTSHNALDLSSDVAV